MDKRQENIWTFVALAMAVGVVYYMLTPLFNYPGQIILNNGGDAAKNYFTYVYHCLHGSGMWFNGMNYPYGEHIVYTDAMPSLAVPITYLRRIVPLDVNTVLSILHLSIVVSYVFAILFTYKIMRLYAVRPLIAIVFSAMIIVMSPQTYRVDGHFALCHASYLPVFGYWLLKYNECARARYIVYIFLLSIFMSFMHPYYGAWTFIFSCFYTIGYFLFVKDSQKEKLKRSLPVLGVSVCTLLSIKVIMALTDPVKDRPTAPQGSLDNLTEKADLLGAFFSPVSHYLQKLGWLDIRETPAEGTAYIGISALIIICVSTVVILLWSFRQRKIANSNRVNENAGLWLTVAIGSLLFAMGVPFIWKMEWLLENISVFRQFRSLGRFGNIFYYVASVYAVVVLYKWYYKLFIKERKALAVSMLLLTMFIWGIEARANMEYIKEDDVSVLKDQWKMFFSKKHKNWNAFIAQHDLKKTDFQAVIVLPFVHIGTEKLWTNHWHLWGMVMGFKASLQLDMPIVDVLMSRSSWSQAKEQVRLVGGPWSDKPLLQKINSSKPFLLLAFDEATMGPDEKYLIQASDSIGHFAQCYVYVCYPERIRNNDSTSYAVIKNTAENMRSGDTCINCNDSTWAVMHFDSEKNAKVFAGAGAWSYKLVQDTLFATISFSKAASGQLYEFSCWVLADTVNYKSPNFRIDNVDTNGWVYYSDMAMTSQSVDNNGQWFRTSRYFELPHACDKIRIQLIAGQPNSYISVDEVLLRPANATVISKTADGKLFINNHLYRAHIR